MPGLPPYSCSLGELWFRLGDHVYTMTFIIHHTVYTFHPHSNSKGIKAWDVLQELAQNHGDLASLLDSLTDNTHGTIHM